MRRPLVKELEWGAIAKGLMRADGVIGPLPGLEFLVQGGELKRTGEDFIEFLRAEHSGFRSEVRSGLTLTVSPEAVVNFTLEGGGVEQTVRINTTNRKRQLPMSLLLGILGPKFRRHCLRCVYPGARQAFEGFLAGGCNLSGSRSNAAEF